MTNRETTGNRRVLVIDDNVSIHEDFRKILQARGNGDSLETARTALFGETPGVEPCARYDLDFADQGQTALSLVERARQEGRPYAAAFVDMRMPPGWDGLETIEHMWHVDPDLEIVICTAFSDHPWEEVTRRLGDTDRYLILLKPFDSIEVVQLASSLTRKWDLARQAKLQMDSLGSLVDQRTGELKTANTQLHSLVGELLHSRARILEQNEELNKLATRDSLTGCYNRRALFEQFEVVFQEAKKEGTEVGCLMVDIDHFKSFNDRFGHAVGDQVLVVVAKTIHACIRPVDILGRYGGEEFCLVLPKTGAETAMEAAERVRRRIEAESGLALRTMASIRVTASLGVASTAFGATDVSTLINEADEALYRAKQAGRNRVCLARSWNQAGARPESIPGDPLGGRLSG